MREYLSLGVRLMIISLVAALLLSVTKLVTKDEIARQAEAKAQKARLAVLPGDGGFEPVEGGDGILAIYRGNGGYVFEINARGYGSSGMDITIGVKEGRVTGVSVDASGETPGLGSKAGGAEFLSGFIGADASGMVGADTISGATISSTAVKAAIRSAIEYYDAHLKGGGQP